MPAISKPSFFIPQALSRRLLVAFGGVLAGLVVFWINAELASPPSGSMLPAPPVNLSLDSVSKPEPLREKIRTTREPPDKPRPPEKWSVGDPDVRQVLLPPRIDIDASDLPGTVRGGLTRGPRKFPISDSDAIVPLVRVEPNYPARAAARGTEGYVKLAFSVLSDGSVADIEVIDAEPRGMFEQSARRAIAKWKFRPRTGATTAARVIQTLNFRLPAKQ